MESRLLNVFITKYEVKGDHAIEKISYDEKTLRVFINKTNTLIACRWKSGTSMSADIRFCEK